MSVPSIRPNPRPDQNQDHVSVLRTWLVAVRLFYKRVGPADLVARGTTDHTRRVHGSRHLLRDHLSTNQGEAVAGWTT